VNPRQELCSHGRPRGLFTSREEERADDDFEHALVFDNKAKWGDSGRNKELSETERTEKYAAIVDWAEQKKYSVTFMCDQLGGCVRGTTGGARQGRASVSVPTPSSPNTSSKSTPSWTGIPACAGSGPSSSCAGCGSGPKGSGG
jgi:hypothetical protein